MRNQRFPRLAVLAVGVILGAVAFGLITPTQFLASERPHVIPSDQRPVTSLQDLNNAFVDIAESVSPAVVTVFSEKVYHLRRSHNPFDDFFSDFFFGPNQRQRQQPQQREYRQQGHGSGVIVRADGYILTNNHVVAEADTIYVRTMDDREYAATVVGTDPKTDIAVIRIDADDLPTLSLGDSDKLRVGEMVLAIGSPLSASLAHTVTSGIVSAVGRSQVGLADYEDFIQTDAAINPGNSGGALVNLDGELVGLNTAIVSRSGGFQGIGFAVPANMAMNVMTSLIEYGKVVRGWLGVYIQDITQPLAKAMDLEDTRGVLISEVAEDSPAEDAGLQEGDIVIAVEGRETTNSADLRNHVANTPPGTTIDLTVMRDGRQEMVAVTLGELPGDEQVASSSSSALDLLGLKLSPMSGELAREFEIDPRIGGLVITDVDPSGPAFQQGIRPGDVVRSVNRVRVSSIDDVSKILENAERGDTVLLRIIRDNRALYVAVTL